jgi:glutathione S-transferase
MSELRIFSYLPNPRIWKATIVARLCGIELEIRGASPKDIGGWLWDFDARPLTDRDKESEGNQRAGRVAFTGRKLFKTDSFLEAHPFGTVPAAFDPTGSIGIFESNSIMRAVARLGADRCSLYGSDLYSASRIDSFLDVSVLFGREAQIYLLGLSEGQRVDEKRVDELHARATEAFETYVGGIEQALRPARQFLVGESLSLADICFVAEVGLFSSERKRASMLLDAGFCPIFTNKMRHFPLAMAHFDRLVAHPAFAPDTQPYLKNFSHSGTRIDVRAG